MEGQGTQPVVQIHASFDISAGGGKSKHHARDALRLQVGQNCQQRSCRAYVDMPLKVDVRNRWILHSLGYSGNWAVSRWRILGYRWVGGARTGQSGPPM